MSRRQTGQREPLLRFQTAGALAIFVVVLIAYTIQTELTQAVSKVYTKPYLLLYLTHSGYICIFPLHLVILKLSSTSPPIPGLFLELRDTIVSQLNLESYLSKKDDASSASDRLSLEHHPSARQESGENCRWTVVAFTRFLYVRFLKKCLVLTFLITIPSLCWYSAAPLTDMTSITSIYNTNAFFVYVFAVHFLKTEKAKLKKTLAVVAACLGVLIVSFGDYSLERPRHETQTPGMRLAGTILAFAGSLSYAGYEVWYKKAVALPDPKMMETILRSDQCDNSTPDLETDDADEDQDNQARSVFALPEASTRLLWTEPAKPPTSFPQISPAVFLLHANLVTSIIGFFTITFFWVPLPILNWLEWEKIEGPPDFQIFLMIMGAVLMGVIFNGGFMVLLGLWGPVIASVGNLCTLILVAIADLIFVPDSHLTVSVITGCLIIMLAFSVLVADLMKTM